MGIFNESFKSVKRKFQNELTTNKKGAVCPCCNRYNKIYQRKINYSMLRFLEGLHLLQLYSNKNQKYFEAKDVLKEIGLKSTSGMDYGVLIHFGFIEKKTNESKYALTQKGIYFLGGIILAPKYVYLLNNQRIGVSDDVVNVNDVRKKFDKEDL